MQVTVQNHDLRTIRDGIIIVLREVSALLIIRTMISIASSTWPKHNPHYCFFEDLAFWNNQINVDTLRHIADKRSVGLSASIDSFCDEISCTDPVLHPHALLFISCCVHVLDQKLKGVRWHSDFDQMITAPLSDEIYTLL